MTIAQRLTSLVRDGDVVARHGGDEFLVLLGNLEEDTGRENPSPPPLAAAEAAAHRIQQVFTKPFELGETSYLSTASIGIALFPLHADSAAALLKAADAAMYLAKGQGRGYIASYTEDFPTSADGLALSNRLQNALENEEWVLHYQPIVDLASERAVGVEALLRWNEPGTGLVSPSHFLSIAENMGMLNQIGEWVFTEACRQAAEWREHGMALTMAVNLSPSQLNQPYLAARLADLAGMYGLPSDQVTIEITETETMGMPELSALALEELRSEGFLIAIDDFGTGYSSLIRLQHMPVNVLKIDRSFVELLPHNRKARSMVFAQIELARNLGISCIAEGVETEAQRIFLLDAGCGLAQGYLFSEPVPANEIQGRVRPSRMSDRI